MRPAVARIALSYEACELAELARAAVPTTRSTTEAVADAGRILQAAQRFLAAAVVAASEDGLSWPAITDLLTTETGLPRPAIINLLAADPAPSSWRAHLLTDPHEAAEDLDDWVIRHAEEDPGPTPVSQILR